MAYANAVAGGSNTESASRIGMTDWDDPVSVALCAQVSGTKTEPRLNIN